MMWNITRNTAAAVVLTALLGACGSGHDGSPSSSGSHVAKKALSPADELQRSLVAGFTQVKPGNTPLPVQVKFALQSKPEVAQPLDVTIAIVPTASNLDRVFGKVEGEGRVWRWPARANWKPPSVRWRTPPSTAASRCCRRRKI